MKLSFRNSLVKKSLHHGVYSGNLETINKKFNNFLQKNPSVEIVSQSMTGAGTYGSYVLSVVYKKGL